MVTAALMYKTEADDVKGQYGYCKDDGGVSLVDHHVTEIHIITVSLNNYKSR